MQQSEAYFQGAIYVF